MPRSLAVCAAIFLGGCFFEADYAGGSYTCNDGRCPSGLTCNADRRCVLGGDAGLDADAAIDAPRSALTCADPGLIASAGGSASGTTVGRGATVSSVCGGFVMNGRDAAYRIELAAGQQLLVVIEGGRKAYVLASCQPVPATPACVGNARATMGNPLSVMPAAGPSFVIVDDENPASESTYVLTLTVN